VTRLANLPAQGRLPVVRLSVLVIGDLDRPAQIEQIVEFPLIVRPALDENAPFVVEQQEDDALPQAVSI